MAMDPKTDKLIRRTTMVATATAAYLLLTADYGPQENALDPVSLLYSFFRCSLILESFSCIHAFKSIDFLFIECSFRIFFYELFSGIRFCFD